MDKYIKDLASAMPSPGGGSSSIFNAILGVSLISMILNISLKNKKYKENYKEYKTLLIDINNKLKELKIKDEKLFLSLKEAYKDKTILENALLKATEPAKETIDIIINTTSILDKLKTKTPNLLISDLAIASSHLNTASEGCAATILVNTKLLKNESLKKDMNQKLMKNISFIKKFHEIFYEKLKGKLV